MLAHALFKLAEPVPDLRGVRLDVGARLEPDAADDGGRGREGRDGEVVDRGRLVGGDPGFGQDERVGLREGERHVARDGGAVGCGGGGGCVGGGVGPDCALGVVAMGGGRDIRGWAVGGWPGGVGSTVGGWSAGEAMVVGVADAIVAVGFSQGLGASREGACGTGGAGKEYANSIYRCFSESCS